MEMASPGEPVLCQLYRHTFVPYMGRQEAELSPRDRAMRRVSCNLANCQATVQKNYLYDKS